MEHANKSQINFLRLALAFAAASYFLWHALSPQQWSFFDGVDLIIHEAGHTIFLLFGNFLHILGGSLLQILVPLIFVSYFALTRQHFSSALTLFWFGQSLINVSVYVGDAATMQLPLLGGEASIHDWNYLLSSFGLLPHTAAIAKIIYSIGFLGLSCAFFLSLYFSIDRKQSQQA